MRIVSVFAFLKPVLIVLAIVCFAFKIQQRNLFNHFYFFNRGYRIPEVAETLKAYKQTGQILLLGSSTGTYSQLEAHNGDDPGIYYFLTYIADVFPSIDLKSIYYFFFGGILLTGYLLSCIGFRLLIVDQKSLMLANLYSGFFTVFSFFILDVYVLSCFIISFIPLFIWLYNTKIKSGKMGPYLFLFVLGILAGFSNQFRSQSGTGIVIFIIAFLVVNYNKGIKAKAIIGLSAILLFSCYMPAVFMKYQLNKRDNWLVHHEPGFDPVKLSGGHTIWHPLYLGLAFIENPYGIIWEDQNAFDKINSVNPGLKLNTYSIESERILKSEYLKILKNDFGFVVRCYFRKFIYVVLFLLLFFNYGLVLLFRAGISFRFLIPFFITICFYSLPGVLVWPIPHYFIGAIHLVVILFICLSADILMKPSLP